MAEGAEVVEAAEAAAVEAVERWLVAPAVVTCALLPVVAMEAVFRPAECRRLPQEIFAVARPRGRAEAIAQMLPRVRRSDPAPVQAVSIAQT